MGDGILKHLKLSLQFFYSVEEAVEEAESGWNIEFHLIKSATSNADTSRDCKVASAQYAPANLNAV